MDRSRLKNYLINPEHPVYPGQGTLLSRIARIGQTPAFTRLCDYFAIDDAIFGLSGLTSNVLVFGIITRSISSMGIAPSKI